MGLAIETIAFNTESPGTTAAATMMTGDSATLRTFNQTAGAKLIAAIREGAGAGYWSVASPLLHDAVRGIRLNFTESPAGFGFPRDVGQPLHSADTLTFGLTGGTAEDDVGAATIIYGDVDGISAKLYRWGDIAPHVAHIKPVEVDLTTNAAATAWTDTLLNTTETLLKSDSSYAVLGYVTDTACACIGIKGQATGNLRIAGPGITVSSETATYFSDQAELYGFPFIPVIRGIDQGAIYLSQCGVAEAVAIKGGLILAQLDSSFSG